MFRAVLIPARQQYRFSGTSAAGTWQGTYEPLCGTGINASIMTLQPIPEPACFVVLIPARQQYQLSLCDTSTAYWVSQRYRCSDTSTAGTWRAGSGRTKVERVRKRSLLPEDDMYKHVVTTAVSLSMCDTSTAYRASSMRYWYRRNAPAFRLRAHPRTHPPDVVGRPCQALGSKAPGPLEP